MLFGDKCKLLINVVTMHGKLGKHGLQCARYKNETNEKTMLDFGHTIHFMIQSLHDLAVHFGFVGKYVVSIIA